MTTYRVIHKTEYIYEAPASLCYNEVRLLPRSFDQLLFNQQCLDAYVVVEPVWGDHRERIDFFGNRVLFYAIRQPHEVMTIIVNSHVRLDPYTGSANQTFRRDAFMAQAAQSAPWEQVRDALRKDLRAEVLDARQYAMPSPLVPMSTELLAYAQPSFSVQRPILEAVYDLMTRIYQDFDFVPGVTTVATPISEVLTERRGVCQDFAHLMIGCLRAKGLAARYVSGYIETLPPPGQEKLQGSDASHAWCALYLPGVGWLDFDPTNHLLPADQHVVLGWGRDFADVTPLKGVFFGDGRHQLKVSVDMVRVD
ncbi:MAG: transglutaminase family protein [Caldilineaceae bacterium]|nr:transglutaminase family protein [Caldilineaceae bacterium]